jgi:hypothetical protein
MDWLVILFVIGFGIFAIWLIISVLSTMFIFTGPPDAYDVDIDPDAKIIREKK